MFKIMIYKSTFGKYFLRMTQNIILNNFYQIFGGNHHRQQFQNDMWAHEKMLLSNSFIYHEVERN
jgi:hypothetical protein